MANTQEKVNATEPEISTNTHNANEKYGYKKTKTEIADYLAVKPDRLLDGL